MTNSIKTVIAEYQQRIEAENAFDSVLLPIGSGIEISQKRFVN